MRNTRESLAAHAKCLTARIPDAARRALWDMNLDTYKSALVDGLFVTVPSVSGKTTIELLDELSALRLAPIRRGYELPGDGTSENFARFVMGEIVRKGFATHGPEDLF